MACKNKCIIAEGHPSVTLCNGQTVPHHGHKTSNGCPLVSTLNDIHGWENLKGGAIAPAFYQDDEGEWQPKYGKENLPEESPDEQVKAIDQTTGEPIPDLAYFIEAPDGTTYTGHTDADGLCERVKTFAVAELTVWLGEDALRKQQGR